MKEMNRPCIILAFVFTLHLHTCRTIKRAIMNLAWEERE